MDDRRIIDFLRNEGWGLGITTLVVFSLAILVVEGSRRLNLIPISYSAFGNLVVAVVAVTSLYIAWRELVRKTEPNLTIEFDFEHPESEDVQEKMTLKLINSGANILTPVNAWYGLMKREGEDFYFTNREMGTFTDSGLQPGETASLEIGSDVVMFQLHQVNIRDWKGVGVSIEGTDKHRVNRTILVDPGDLEVKIQKIFDSVMNNEWSRGLRLSAEEIRSSEVDELIEEYNLDGGLKIGRVDE